MLSRSQLLDLAHRRDWEPFDHSSDIGVARLRKKIERDPAKPQIIKDDPGGRLHIGERATMSAALRETKTGPVVCTTLAALNKTCKLENGASDLSSTLGRREKIDCTFACGTYSANPLRSSGETHELRGAPNPRPHRLRSNSLLAREPGPRRLRRSSCRHGREQASR